MKISVIVPVYNCEKYLEACLDSILAQTYKDLEIILIDDGSKDESPRICDRYAADHGNVTVIHKENGGVSSARNRGMEIATGELISFIDGDDTLEEDMYELLVSKMREYDADISHCGYKHIVRDEIRLVTDTKQVVCQNKEKALECLVGGYLFGSGLWNKLFKYELVKDISFCADLKINEDLLFNFEAFSRAEKTVFADYAKYNYIARIGSSACFVTADGKKSKDSCEVSRIIYERLYETSLKFIAGEKYLRALSGHYRYCSRYNKTECKAVASRIWNVYTAVGRGVGRNMKITANMIHFMPFLYRGVYAAYDKIRKPNWELRR